VSTPESRFVIVPHRPRLRPNLLVLGLAWALSLILTSWLTVRYAAPKLQRLTVQQAELRQERQDLRAEIEQLRNQLTMAQRSDEVTRGANKDLQASLLARESEIAALRADVGFYERLVSGSAQRQGLTVHSLALRAEAGSFHYSITLTQSMKRGSLTQGVVSMAVEGALAGRLTELDWPALRQDADAAPQPFEFRYFQQIEGIIMLPAGFEPQRVRVIAKTDGKPVERVYPWESALAPAAVASSRPIPPSPASGE